MTTVTQSIVDGKSVEPIAFIPKQYLPLITPSSDGNHYTKVMPSSRKGKMTVSLDDGAFLETDAPVELTKLETCSGQAVVDSEGYLVSLTLEFPTKQKKPESTGKKSPMYALRRGLKV